jgi:hypothetical protein
MLPDLSARLAAIEPLRRRAGLFGQLGPLLWLWFSRMGLAMLVAGVSSALAVWLGMGRIPDAALFLLVAVLSMGPPLAGLVAVMRPTYLAVTGRDGASADYHRRLMNEVVQPLVKAATPNATCRDTQAFDFAQFVASGVYPGSDGWKHTATMSVSGQDGASWSATPVRVTRSVSASSGQTRTKLEIMHDGLFVRAAFPTGLRRPVVLADRANGDAMRMKSRPLATVFGRLPAAPTTGDAAFDRQVVSLSDEPADLAALTIDLRRALVSVVEQVGGPVRIALNADGVAMAFHERGRFRGLSASEELDSPIKRKTDSQVVADMTVRFGADADLLSKIPDAIRTLHQAVSYRAVSA